MQCPHCDDPKGIIWIDDVPEPCCDEIITAGAPPARRAEPRCTSCMQVPVAGVCDCDHSATVR
ncbi:hypothetical protein LCGC14_1820050 [marine sediment metagenome]|uniref:Uncharacterized protein n=1 Tax=marine sediment metagenome TaxID=412755 RepID=A0A0F9GJ81_9ZZZZ